MQIHATLLRSEFDHNPTGWLPKRKHQAVDGGQEPSSRSTVQSNGRRDELALPPSSLRAVMTSAFDLNKFVPVNDGCSPRSSFLQLGTVNCKEYTHIAPLCSWLPMVRVECVSAHSSAMGRAINYNLTEPKTLQDRPRKHYINQCRCKVQSSWYHCHVHAPHNVEGFHCSAPCEMPPVSYSALFM